jgi:thioredoxin 1
MSRVIDVDEYTFDEEVLQSSRPVLVDFCIIDRATSATMLAVLEGLATDVQGRIKIARVDVAASPSLAAQYEIALPPRLLVFQNGVVIHQTADLLGETPVAAGSPQAGGLLSRLLGVMGLKRTGHETSHGGAGLDTCALKRVAAMGLIGLGGAFIGMICGWDLGPLSLELGRGNLAWMGAASGGLATIAATRHASERSEARARSQKQMEIIRKVLGSLGPRGTGHAGRTNC